MNSQIHPILRTLALISTLAVQFSFYPELVAGMHFRSLPQQGESVTPMSKELEEASELIRKVVKLYGERKYEEGLPLAKRALQIREKAMSPNHQLVINAQVNLAEVYIALRKFMDAESPLDRAVKSYRTGNPTDVRLADLLQRKALVEYALGDSESAQSAYEESLRIKEKVFGVDSARTDNSLLMLAEFHQFAGHDAKAATYFLRLISVREKASGPNQNDELVDAISRYACLLGKLKKQEEADRMHARIASLRLKAPVVDSRPGSSSTDKEAFLGGGVLNGKALTLAKPDYPEEARISRIYGTVVVQVWIDETGNVRRACAIAGPFKLRRAAEVAAYQSKFSPTKLSGMPVKVTGVITYNFVSGN